MAEGLVRCIRTEDGKWVAGCDVVGRVADETILETRLPQHWMNVRLRHVCLDDSSFDGPDISLNDFLVNRNLKQKR
jgi:hypothetical protein